MEIILKVSEIQQNIIEIQEILFTKGTKEGDYCSCPSGQVSDDGLNCVKCKVNGEKCMLVDET